MAVHPLPSTSPTQGVHAALDALAQLDPGGLSAAGHAELLVDLKRIESRVAAYRLRVLTAAERAKTAEKSGDGDTASWAAKHTHDDGRETSRQANLARKLKDRSPTRQALDSGDISEGHAEVIVRAGEQMPEDLTPAERTRVEDDLVGKARSMSPSALRRRARRQLDALNKDRETVDADEERQVADEEARARARTRLTFRDNHDGTVSGFFTVPVFEGHLLRKIIQTMTAPRRTNGNGNGTGTGPCAASASADAGGALFGPEAPGDQSPQSGTGGPRDDGSADVNHSTSDDADIAHSPAPARLAQARRTDWANAHGLALAELIGHLPTDHLSPKTAATIVVTLDEPVLRGYLAAAGLDTGEKISAARARQLACNSALVPVVLGGKSLPLDLGQSARLFSEAQRTALATRHTTCAAEGCQRPYAWCELHHAVPWSKGGRTDLDQAVPLCHRHHRMAHDHNYHPDRTPTGGMTFTMRQ